MNNSPFGYSARFRTRCIAYVSIWLLAVLAYQVFVGPDSPTETDLSPLQQFIRLPLYLPLMATLGLARALELPLHRTIEQSSDFSTFVAFLVSVATFATVGTFTLKCSRNRAFVPMLFIHAAIVTIGLIFYIYLTRELSDSP